MASRFPAGHYCGGGGGGKDNGNAKESSNSKDNVFDLDSAAFASDEFRMHEFKVKRCPRARPHDWTQCPFAHPGEKARRRDPRRYKYSGTACPEFRKSGCCRRGDACPFAHGVFECWLHPSRYRTQLCTDGTNCKRRVCFFAHVDSELRHPEDDPGVAQKQVQAELAAEVQTLQQQHLTQALQALLLQTTSPATTPERQPLQLPALTLEMLKQNSEVPSTEMLTEQPPDNGTSTAALQLVLLQQLAAKEHQQQQSMSGEKLSDVQTSAADTVGNGAIGNKPAIPQVSDVYDTLNQLKQISLSATAPVSSATPAVGPSVDTAALLSQLLPNGSAMNGTDLHANPLLLSSLLQHNAMKMEADAGSQTRRSIDNSYLSPLISDATQQAFVSSLGFPVPAMQNGAYLTSGVNGMTSSTVAPPAHAPVTSNGNFPVSSTPASAMYSVENIQRLLQNPAFSSNLSQLFQTNPALFQQLAGDSMDQSNQGRRSIDNSYLTPQVMSNGVMHGLPPSGDPPQQAAPLVLNGYAQTSQPSDHDKVLNGAVSSQALLQELTALKMQLENCQNAATTLAGGMQPTMEAPLNIPPNSSPVSVTLNTSVPATMPQSSPENHN